MLKQAYTCGFSWVEKSIALNTEWNVPHCVGEGQDFHVCIKNAGQSGLELFFQNEQARNVVLQTHTTELFSLFLGRRAEGGHTDSLNRVGICRLWSSQPLLTKQLFQRKPYAPTNHSSPFPAVLGHFLSTTQPTCRAQGNTGPCLVHLPTTPTNKSISYHPPQCLSGLDAAGSPRWDAFALWIWKLLALELEESHSDCIVCGGENGNLSFANFLSLGFSPPHCNTLKKN